MELTLEEKAVMEVDDLLSRIPVLELRQFYRFLHLFTGLEGEGLVKLVDSIARRGIVLISENDYVTNKNAYDVVAEKFDEEMRVNGPRRFRHLEPKAYYRECMECINIVLDLFPISKEFHLVRDLFHITFANDAKNRIYEIIKIPDGKELLNESLLVKESTIYKGKIGQHIREATRRIALVDKAVAAKAVPYCGFSFICMNDPTNKKGFVVIEKREGDLWKDAPVTE